ncbi:hypothetical protein [Paenibacillus sp. GYB003]|uniref:hypothetical protein n=1 Tax=Paenibacillus sp. GYB003 TaxID=2994392 RepID=UPI002F963CA4
MIKQVCLSLLTFILFFVIYVHPASANSYDSAPKALTLFEDTDLYDKADERSGPVATISPQTVFVTGMEPGWIMKDHPWVRIGTWLGDKWIRPKVAYPGEETAVSTKITTHYDLDLYQYPLAGYPTGAYIGPQTVDVVAVLGPWMKINTWLGEKWVLARYPIESAEKPLIEQDEDGYVTVSDLQEEKSAIHGNVRIKSGVVQIHKDIAGKSIRLLAIGQDGKTVGTSRFVFIADQDTAPPEPGDIRSFETDLSVIEKTAGYRVVIEELFREIRYDDYIRTMYGDPISLTFGPPSGFSGKLSIGDFHPFTVSLYNTSQKTLTVEPIEMEFNVYRSNEQNEQLDLVYSYKLPVIRGTIETKTGYSLTVPWKQSDGDRQPLPAGRYILQLSRPDTISFTREGDMEAQTYQVRTDTRHPWRFGVEYVESAFEP